jgi:beta-phosphoglucomutase-like phosphatase (HAD superfamily)
MISQLEKQATIKVDPEAKGLIFDCDGTLADTVPLHLAAWKEAMQAHGVEYSHEFMMEQMGVPTRDIVRIINRRFGHDLDPETFGVDKERRFKKMIPQIRPIEPVLELARAHAGRLPMAVASGGGADNVLPTLKAIGMEGFFPVIITADDPVKPKPAPDIFLEAARRMGVEPRYCQVFEDGSAGLEAAGRAGMIVTNVLSYLESNNPSGQKPG